MRYIFPILALFLLVSSCGKDTEETTSQNDGMTPPPSALPGSDGLSKSTVVLDQVTGEPTVVEKPLYAISSMIGPSPKSKIDPIGPKIYLPQPQTPQEERVVNVLSKNYWVVQTLVRVNDKPANIQNQGAWFQFRPDGTYDYGYFKEKVGSGAWTFDGKEALLHMDSELMTDDREWSIKMSKDEDLMIWVGNEKYHTNDIQMRLYNFIQIPRNRSEMGLKEKNGIAEQ